MQTIAQQQADAAATKIATAAAPLAALEKASPPNPKGKNKALGCKIKPGIDSSSLAAKSTKTEASKAKHSAAPVAAALRVSVAAPSTSGKQPPPPPQQPQPSVPRADPASKHGRGSGNPNGGSGSNGRSEAAEPAQQKGGSALAPKIDGKKDSKPKKSKRRRNKKEHQQQDDEPAAAATVGADAAPAPAPAPQAALQEPGTVAEEGSPDAVEPQPQQQQQPKAPYLFNADEIADFNDPLTTSVPFSPPPRRQP